MTPGALVREHREALGWSQSELARVAGTRQPVISRIESGHANPTVDMLTRLADAMGAELTLSLVPRGQRTQAA